MHKLAVGAPQHPYFELSCFGTMSSLVMDINVLQRQYFIIDVFYENNRWIID
jgi:hypothetical protein